MSHGLINPDELPGVGLHLEAVSAAAADIRASGSAIQQGGSDVVTAWAALPLSYESTGAEAIYAAMTPVQTASDRVSGDLAALARALNDWVSAVQPILLQREALVDDAHALHRDVKNFQPKIEATGNLAVSFLPVLVSNWWEDPHLKSRNSRLIGRGYLLGEKLRVANEDLANAIRRAASLSTTAVVKAAKTAPDGLTTPWGDASAREESCAEKVVGFPAHLGLGILNGAWDLVGGLGMLTGGYDFKSWPPPEWKMAGDLLSGNLQQLTTDGNAWLSGWGQSWVGMGHLLTGLSMGVGGPLMTEVIMPGQISALKAQGADTSALEAMQQWTRDSFTSEVDLFGGFVGYQAPQEWWKATGDEWGAGWADWGKDPGGTGGKALFNVATLILPVKGGGAILDGLKTARIGVEGAEGVAGLADDAGRLTSSDLSGAATDLDKAAMRLDAAMNDASRFGSASHDLTSGLGKSPLDDAGAFSDHLRTDDPIVQHPVEPIVHPHGPEPATPHADAPEPTAPRAEPAPETPPAHDAPDAGGSGDAGPVQPFDVTDRATWPWDFTDPTQVYEHAFHNMDSDTALLGKFEGAGAPGTYSAIAKENGYAYFELETENGIDSWSAVQDANGLSNSDMFETVNVPFLDDVMIDGKTIEFSHNPIGDRGALGDEYRYIVEHSDGRYIFDPNAGSGGAFRLTTDAPPPLVTVDAVAPHIEAPAALHDPHTVPQHSGPNATVSLDHDGRVPPHLNSDPVTSGSDGLTGYDHVGSANEGPVSTEGPPAGHNAGALDPAHSAAALPNDLAALADQHVTNSGQTVLGSFPEYIAHAQASGASYFDLGPTWDDLVAQGIDPWQLNVHFLDGRIAAGDTVLLPFAETDIIPGTYLEREVSYLLNHGYGWRDTMSLSPKGPL